MKCGNSILNIEGGDFASAVSLLPVETLGGRETAGTGLLLEIVKRVRIATSLM